MNCYYYKTINTSRDPILKNADLTVILMMENSTRFKYDPFILCVALRQCSEEVVVHPKPSFDLG